MSGRSFQDKVDWATKAPKSLPGQLFPLAPLSGHSFLLKVFFDKTHITYITLETRLTLAKINQ